MVAKKPSAATETQDPLAPFVRLSRSIYLREPQQPPVSATTTTTDTNDDDDSDDNLPSTIVIAFWFSAAPRILVKYVAAFARLAPSARIIFLLSTASDFWLYPPTQWAHRRRLMPAVEAIRASIATTSTTTGRKTKPVFMHIFSNGGVFTAAHLLLAYRHVTGTAMPISSMILDSAPGRSSVARSAKALSYALPRTRILRPVGMGIIYFVLVVSWLWRRITRSRDPLAFTRAALIDDRLVSSTANGTKKGTKRCYIYSDADDLILPAEVEQHAAEAAARGWPVEREKFLGSPHVGHMRADPERYWGIVGRYLRGEN